MTELQPQSIQAIHMAQRAPEQAFAILEPHVHAVHQQLVEAYGTHVQSDWQPTADRVHFLPTAQFWQRVGELETTETLERFQAMGVVAVTTPDDPRLIMVDIDSIESDTELDMLLAEEMLHAWGLQASLDFGTEEIFPEPFRAGASDYIVRYLGYRALGVFGWEESQVPSQLEGIVLNRIYLHALLQHLPAESIGHLITACQIGSSPDLQTEVNQTFAGVARRRGDDSPYTQLCTMMGALYLFETADEQQSQHYENMLMTLLPRFAPYFE